MYYVNMVGSAVTSYLNPPFTRESSDESAIIFNDFPVDVCLQIINSLSTRDRSKLCCALKKFSLLLRDELGLTKVIFEGIKLPSGFIDEDLAPTWRYLFKFSNQEKPPRPEFRDYKLPCTKTDANSEVVVEEDSSKEYDVQFFVTIKRGNFVITPTFLKEIAETNKLNLDKAIVHAQSKKIKLNQNYGSTYS